MFEIELVLTVSVKHYPYSDMCMLITFEVIIFGPYSEGMKKASFYYAAEDGS